jgi:tetratricopeptide (TPR) repeat protein
MPACGRSMRVRASVVFACALFTCVLSALDATPARAQRAAEPPRPRLAAAADTNDAGEYARLAHAIMRSDPRQAANALHWAVRLDPSRGEALYARRVALLLQSPQRLKLYMDGDRRTIQSPEIRAADSLYFRSLMRDPFMIRIHDRLLLDAYVDEWARGVERRNRNVDGGALRYDMDNYLRRASPSMRAWYAYTDRMYDAALREYGNALKRSRSKAWLHAERAHIYVVTTRLNEAEAEMRLAIEDARRRDEKNVVHFYDSKAFYEYSHGILLQALNRPDDALEAYGRALQEDLTFYPAHERMAGIATMRGDTATAIASLALATAVDAVDVLTRLNYGMLLRRTGDNAAAETVLAALVDAEPYYPLPRAELGYALEALGRSTDAVAAYEGFLDRARRGDPLRRDVTVRLERLRTAIAAGERP